MTLDLDEFFTKCERQRAERAEQAKTGWSYLLPEYGESIDDDGLYPVEFKHPDSWSAEDAACEAASDFHSNRDGWESSWPIQFAMYYDGELKAVVEVEREWEPTFCGSIVKEEASS